FIARADFPVPGPAAIKFVCPLLGVHPRRPIDRNTTGSGSPAEPLARVDWIRLYMSTLPHYVGPASDGDQERREDRHPVPALDRRLLKDEPYRPRTRPDIPRGRRPVRRHQNSLHDGPPTLCVHI